MELHPTHFCPPPKKEGGGCCGRLMLANPCLWLKAQAGVQAPTHCKRARPPRRPCISSGMPLAAHAAPLRLPQNVKGLSMALRRHGAHARGGRMHPRVAAQPCSAPAPQGCLPPPCCGWAAPVDNLVRYDRPLVSSRLRVAQRAGNDTPLHRRRQRRARTQATPARRARLTSNHGVSSLMPPPQRLPPSARVHQHLEWGLGATLSLCFDHRPACGRKEPDTGELIFG